jgi:F420-0:gamma-glutamyl ligase-like protein
MTLNLSRKKPVTPKGQLITIMLTLVIFLGVMAGVVFTVNFFGWNSKVDVANYPASVTAELTDKGKKFVQTSYLSNKREVSGDYYKVLSTSDSCQAVLTFYKTEAVSKGYKFTSEGRLLGTDTLGASFVRDRKNLTINCAPLTEGYLKNVTTNGIIILVGD